jgi:hypothetical protein
MGVPGNDCWKALNEQAQKQVGKKKARLNASLDAEPGLFTPQPWRVMEAFSPEEASSAASA